MSQQKGRKALDPKLPEELEPQSQADEAIQHQVKQGKSEPWWYLRVSWKGHTESEGHTFNSHIQLRRESVERWPGGGGGFLGTRVKQSEKKVMNHSESASWSCTASTGCGWCHPWSSTKAPTGTVYAATKSDILIFTQKGTYIFYQAWNMKL